MIGVDIVQISRVQLNEAFINHVLTNEEKEEFNGIQSEKRKREYLAGRFACKEAIFKATQDIHYLSYSILHESNGRPNVLDHPEIEISVSHDGDYVVAFISIAGG